MRLQTRNLALAAAIAALMLVGAGCSKSAAPAAAPTSPKPVPTAKAPNGAPTPAPAPATVPPTPAPSMALGGCANPYYPFKNGLAIDYQTTAGGTVTSYTASMAVTSATAAKLSFAFPDKKLTVDQDLTCVNGTIRTSSFMNLGAVGQVKTETKSVEGDLMPSDVRAGSTWTTKYQVLTKVAGRDMTMDVSSASKAYGEEPVTVPAGTFTALKIEITTTTAFNIPGVPSMKPTVMTSTEWWVKGIGPVKMTSTTPTGDVVTTAMKVTNP